MLDVNGVKEYTASISENPPQLLIDLFKKPFPPGSVKTAKANHNSADSEDRGDNRGAPAEKPGIEHVAVNTPST